MPIPLLEASTNSTLLIGDKMRVLFIYNPHSGKQIVDHKDKYLDYIHGSQYDCVFFETKPNYGGYDYLMETEEVYDVIVSIGGDGTISKTVDAMIQRDLDAKLLIIPAGSTNEYAQTLGVAFEKIEESLLLLDIGSEKEVDVGLLNGKHFTYVAAFGNFTAASYETPQKWKNIVGHFAYWVYGVVKLNTIRSYHYKVSFNNKTYDDTFLFGLISNANQFGRVFKYDDEDVSLDDGLFEVLLIRKPKKPLEYIELLKNLLNNEYEGDLFLKGKTDKIKLESKYREYTWNLDGENGGKHEVVELEVLNKRLKVLT